MGNHLPKRISMHKKHKTEKLSVKLLHKIIPANDFLYKIKIKDLELCDFCQDKSETLLNLFWSCKYAQNSWIAIENWLHEKDILAKQRMIDKLDGHRT